MNSAIKAKDSPSISFFLSHICHSQFKAIYFLSRPLKTPQKKASSNKSILINSSYQIIPLKKQSEDAVIVKDNFIVIADGVGEWKNFGIDPSIYSQSLCEAIAKTLSSSSIQNETELKEKVVSSINSLHSTQIIGGATFLTIYLDAGANKAYSVALGDTLFSVLRFDKEKHSYFIAHKSKEQYHSFNTPFQCGYQADPPHEANIFSIDIEPGDVIIAGTDGLFDNVSDDDLISMTNEENEADKLSLLIANKARNNSQDQNYISPFAIKARENGKFYIGGKPDDITIVVMMVREENEGEKEEKRSIRSIGSKTTSDSRITELNINEEYYL